VGGENGHGAGVVRSLREFDREQQKEYHVPIVMRDSGVPSMTATRTLTIVIGDLNDNRHYPAHKHVTAFNLDGIYLTTITRRPGAAFSKVPRKILGKLHILLLLLLLLLLHSFLLLR